MMFFVVAVECFLFIVIVMAIFIFLSFLQFLLESFQVTYVFP